MGVTAGRYPSFSPTAVAARRPVRSQPRNWSGVLLPFVLALVILAGTTAYGLARPGTHVQPPAPGSRGSLVWGNGLFASRAEIKAWLTLHQASYRTWAKTHPAALRLLPAKR